MNNQICWCGHGKGLHRVPVRWFAWLNRRFNVDACLGHPHGGGSAWCGCSGWRPR